MVTKFKMFNGKDIKNFLKNLKKGKIFPSFEHKDDNFSILILSQKITKL